MIHDNTPNIADWEIDQVIAFDWYDGPRSGVCRFKHPHMEVSFELLDERRTTDDLDDRLYYLTLLPPDSIDELKQRIEQFCGPISTPIWIPPWPNDPVQRLPLDEFVSNILARGHDLDLVILSRDFQTFQRKWTGQKRDSASDWFVHLGI